MILLLWLLWARKVTKIVKINKEKIIFYVLDPKKGLKMEIRQNTYRTIFLNHIKITLANFLLILPKIGRFA